MSLFDEAAGEYNVIRPGLPGALFEALLNFAGGGPRPHVVEVGCGTGAATRSLAAAGCRVTAIEPGPRMAAFARTNLQAFPDVEVRTGAFETADLAAGSADIIVAANSWHWVPQPAGWEQVVRVLRPGGTFAIMAYEQVASEGRDFFRLSQGVHLAVEGRSTWEQAPLREDYTPTGRAVIERSGLFGPVSVVTRDWDQSYTSAEYELLVRSYSPTALLPPEARERLIRGLRDLIDREFDGSIVRPLVASVSMAKLAAGRRGAIGAS